MDSVTNDFIQYDDSEEISFIVEVIDCKQESIFNTGLEISPYQGATNKLDDNVFVVLIGESEIQLTLA